MLKSSMSDYIIPYLTNIEESFFFILLYKYTKKYYAYNLENTYYNTMTYLGEYTL